MGCRQANFCFVCGLKQIGETDEEASSRREADRRWMQEHRSKLEQEYRAEKERFEAEWQAKLGVIQPAIGDAPPATLAAAIAVAAASIDASQQLDAGLGSAPPPDRTDATDQAEGSRRISLLKRIGSKATLPSPRRGSAGSLGTMAQMPGPSPGCLKLMAEPSSSAAQRM